MGNIIVGVLLLLLGGFMVGRADLMLQFQIWTNRVIMGAQYVPSARTYKIIRGLGVFFVLLALLILAGAFL